MLPSARDKDRVLEADTPWYQTECPSPAALTEQGLTDEEVNQLFSLAILSLTPSYTPNWRFVIAHDPGLKEKIRRVTGDQAQITETSLLVILCADTKAWEKNPPNHCRYVYKDKTPILLPDNDYYPNKEQMQRDEAMCSCGIAAQTLMLSAKAMGYDSCPVYHFDADLVGRLINLPKEMVVAMLVVIGKTVKKPWPRKGKVDFREVLLTDQFQ